MQPQPQFDERTPAEHGFAEVFAREVAPRIAAAHAEHDRGVTAKRTGASVLAVGLVAGVIAVIALWTADASSGGGVVETHWEDLIIGVAFLVGALVWGLIMLLKPPPTDRAYRGSFPKMDLAAIVARHLGMEFADAPSDGIKALNATSKLAGSYPLPLEKTKSALRGRVGIADMEAWVVEYWTRTKRHDNGIEEGGSSNPDLPYYAWLAVLRMPVPFPSRVTLQERPQGVLVVNLDNKSVTLESPDFNKRFDVRADDQTEARVLLPPDVIDHLANFRPTSYSQWFTLALHFEGDVAEAAVPIDRTAWERWEPQDAGVTIAAAHDLFDEFAALTGLIRDIDAIAEGEGRRGEIRRRTS